MSPWGVAARAFPVAAAIAVLPAPALSDLPPPMEILVGTSVRMVPPKVTVGQARAVLGIRPTSGDLVDVDGVVLQQNAFPGSILVNGREAPGSRVLSEGDVLEVVDERDHFEPVSHDIVPVPAGTIPNPQTHLGTTPGEEVITSGSISGKLVSSVFRPTGEAQAPRAVALTFDDGPSPRWTPKILRVLRRLRVGATFFMIGYLAERYPEIVRDVVEAGMSVGNHSLSHPYDRPFEELHTGQLRQQILGGHRVFTDLGTAPTLFRPPGGSWSPEVLTLAEEAGERTVLWSVDSFDARGLRPGIVARRVVKQAEPGAIILLHDGGGDRSATLKALPRIVRGLRARGISLRKL
jgi:peptidoglycan/xylan/chitin deacetylase (PgdA/CDA1 family)